MNTVAQAPSMVNSIAFQFGVEAAQCGEACVPEMVFIQRSEQIKFATGYESVSGPTFATVQFTGSEMPKPVVAKKPHNWSDYNADRAIRKVSAHLDKLDAIFERTARETPHLAGELLWLPA